jgi:hypothetical protein
MVVQLHQFANENGMAPKTWIFRHKCFHLVIEAVLHMPTFGAQADAA